MDFKVVNAPNVKKEISDEVVYIKSENKLAAKKLVLKIQEAYNQLKLMPFYQIRYNDVRCLPINGFAYMLHFIVDEKKKTVKILAFLSTHKDPNTSWIK
jgi:ParE toxin of type II toxin-antitoxin system, parDE